MKPDRDEKNTKDIIPVPTIRRLPLYLSFLKSARRKNNIFISAPEIAQELFIDPTQITKDFSCLKIKGKTKIGYESEVLIRVIEDFLGYHISRRALIVGLGHLGTAIISYNDFVIEGMRIVAGFDHDPAKVGQVINDVIVHDISVLRQYLNNSNVEIGIITVPADEAQNVADIMIECDIKAIWNFSARPISAPTSIIVENTSIDSGLAMIKWKLHRNRPMIYKNRIL